MSTQELREIQPLKTLDTERLRQRLAGITDEFVPQATRETLRLLAIDFVSLLPRVFGESLDRVTLWDRIASGIQTAFAKTVGGDVEFFASEVFRHISAGAAVARETSIAITLNNMTSLGESDREALLAYFSSHLPVLLVHARERWEAYKSMNKKGGDA